MISFEEAKRRYSQSTVGNKQSVLNLNAAEPVTTPFDYETAKQEALKGKDWYINMVRATASLVAKGATDREIEAEMISWTIPPFSSSLRRKSHQIGILTEFLDQNVNRK